jgi:hypothetical protein
VWKFGRTSRSGQPSPWDQLVSELRAAGYLSPDDDLAALLENYLVNDGRRGVHLPAASPRTDKLSQPLADELVTRLWRMLPVWGYRPRGGFLQVATSTSAPLQSSEALERYGIKLLIHALIGPDKRGAPIPWQAAMRVSRSVGPPLVIILLPVIVPLAVLWSIAVSYKQRHRAGPGRRQTGSDLNVWIAYAVGLAIPGTAVAAWYILWAFEVPPQGPSGRWIALLLAGLFGIQNLFTFWLVSLSIAMDGSNEAREPVAQPMRYLFRNGTAFFALYCVVNAPLTVFVAVVGVLN